MMQTIKPIVGGLNGDHPAELRRQFVSNLLKIREAVETLSSNRPNGRNYRSEEYMQARDQYQEHIDNLREAENYMFEMMDHIDKLTK